MATTDPTTPAPPTTPEPSVPASPPSSVKALLWLGLCVAGLAVAHYFVLDDAWLHWFPAP